MLKLIDKKILTFLCSNFACLDLYTRRKVIPQISLYIDSKDSDQTGQIPRLIGVFTGPTGYFVSFVMHQLKPLYTNGFFLLFIYNNCGIVHCTYLRMFGYNFQKMLYFFGLKIFFTLTNSVDPDKMPHHAAFHLNFQCLLKVRI